MNKNNFVMNKKNFAVEKVRIFFLRVMQSARLMVGVGDYARYMEHIRAHHPELQPMTEKEYFRYCQQSRYPSKDGQIKRCPC